MSPLLRVCVVFVLVLQCCGHGGSVECIKSEMCKCVTNSNFTIDLNRWRSDILDVNTYDSQGNQYTLSPCIPLAGCQSRTQNKAACVWLRATNDVVVLGLSTAFEWNVMSKNYFSVTFKNGTSTGTATPRQAKLIYIVDETVSHPKIEFIGMDHPTSTYIFNIRIKSSYAPFP